MSEQSEIKYTLETPKFIKGSNTTIPFWSQDPNVLLHRDYIFEFFPVDTMSYNQRLNAVTRMVILLTALSFIVTQNVRILIIAGITIFAIYLLHVHQEREAAKEKKRREAFESPALTYLDQNGVDRPSNAFTAPDSNNPFSNVLVPDIQYNPTKKPAPPAYNENVAKDILTQAKQMVVEANPGQPNIADKLFQDLGNEFVFEQSMRPFHSNPATTIPNDQGAFADFCYGSMVSCKEGNLFACARNLSRYTNG